MKEEYKMKYKQNPYINKNEGNNNNNNSNNVSEKDEKDEKKDDNNNSNNISEKEENNNINNSNNIPKKEEKTVTVKIKSQSGIWEKEYNIKTPIDQVRLDLQKGIDPENNSLEFMINNNPIIMDSRPLESIIAEEDQKEIIIEQKIKGEIPNNEKLRNMETIDYIGRPLTNPFEIYIFDVKKKLIKRLKYANEKVKALDLDKYGINSSFCNGMNHLFISGGTNTINSEAINLFWDLDIENTVLKKKIRMPIPKQNHNMIYFNEKVYIIGGDDEKTMFYDVKKMIIGDWPSLNQKKFKPSLIVCNDILFCIDSSGKYLAEYNIEKIEMDKTGSEWVIVKPRINNDISNLIFSQKYFGLIEDKNKNIIFLGGIFENGVPNDNLILQYNVKKNLIEKGEELNLIGFNDIKNLELDEKSFLKIDENTSVIFPYFISREPKILYYHKDTNQLQMKLYHSNPNLTKLNQEQQKNKKEESLKLKNENNPNINKINVSINGIKNNFVGNKISNNKSGKSINNNLNEDEKNNESENNKIGNQKNPQINNIAIEKNSSDSNIDNNNKGSKNNNNLNKSKSSDENKKEKEDNNISKENPKSNKKKEEQEKKSKNSDIKEKVSNRSQEKKKEKEKEKENDNNIDNKSKSDEDQSEIKEDSNEKEETNIQNFQTKEKEKRTDIETFNTDLGSNFHSSVNKNVMNNFKKLENNRAIKNHIRMKNIIQPKDVNAKSLKQSRRKFNNFEINDIEEFTNY